jgi:hypothetical protein
MGNRLTQLLVSPELSTEALTLKLVSFKVWWAFLKVLLG